MFVDFNRVFHPTIEQKIEEYKFFIELHEKNIGNCVTCENYTPPDAPGFVIDFGECKLKEKCFLDKSIYRKDVECSLYKEDCFKRENVEKIRIELKRLKEELENK